MGGQPLLAIAILGWPVNKLSSAVAQKVIEGGKSICVEAGIPPGMSISFVKEKDVDAETINQLLEENKEKEMLKLIVRALLKADALQKGMNLSHYKFNGLSMKIGLPPDISLKFTRVAENS